MKLKKSIPTIAFPVVPPQYSKHKSQQEITLCNSKKHQRDFSPFQSQQVHPSYKQGSSLVFTGSADSYNTQPTAVTCRKVNCNYTSEVSWWTYLGICHLAHALSILQVKLMSTKLSTWETDHWQSPHQVHWRVTWASSGNIPYSLISSFLLFNKYEGNKLPNTFSCCFHFINVFLLPFSAPSQCLW